MWKWFLPIGLFRNPKYFFRVFRLWSILITQRNKKWISHENNCNLPINLTTTTKKGQVCCCFCNFKCDKIEMFRKIKLLNWRLQLVTKANFHKSWKKIKHRAFLFWFWTQRMLSDLRILVAEKEEKWSQVSLRGFVTQISNCYRLGDFASFGKLIKSQSF